MTQNSNLSTDCFHSGFMESVGVWVTRNASALPWPCINIYMQNSKELSVYHSCSQANEAVSTIEDKIRTTLSPK